MTVLPYLFSLCPYPNFMAWVWISSSSLTPDSLTALQNNLQSSIYWNPEKLLLIKICENLAPVKLIGSN